MITPTTAQIVGQFKAGLTMQEIAGKNRMPLLKVEQAIRRWMQVYDAKDKP